MHARVCLCGLWRNTHLPVYTRRPGVDEGYPVTHYLSYFFETWSVTDWLNWLDSNPQIPTHLCLSALELQAHTVSPSFLYWFGIWTHIPMLMQQTLDPLSHLPGHNATHVHMRAQAYGIKHMDSIVTHLSVHLTRSVRLQFTHMATWGPHVYRCVQTQVNVHTH